MVLFIFSYLFPNFLRSNFSTISKPIWLIRDSVSKSSSNLFGFFTSKSNLISENSALKEEIEVLKLKQLDYNLILKENQELKNISAEKKSNFILARVLSKPPVSPYDSLVLDIGTSQGIKKGSKVFLSNNVVIGFVTEITENTSLVELFSKGDTKHNFVLERTGASYDISGMGGFNMMVLMPKDADVLWGDTFVYPGENLATVGNVYYIDTNSQSSFKGVYIKIPTNVFQTKWVYVEK
jgi:rod shape-determining protein MreC